MMSSRSTGFRRSGSGKRHSLEQARKWLRTAALVAQVAVPIGARRNQMLRLQADVQLAAKNVHKQHRHKWQKNESGNQSSLRLSLPSSSLAAPMIQCTDNYGFPIDIRTTGYTDNSRSANITTAASDGSSCYWVNDSDNENDDHGNGNNLLQVRRVKNSIMGLAIMQEVPDLAQALMMCSLSSSCNNNLNQKNDKSPSSGSTSLSFSMPLIISGTVDPIVSHRGDYSGVFHTSLREAVEVGSGSNFYVFVREEAAVGPVFRALLSFAKENPVLGRQLLVKWAYHLTPNDYSDEENAETYLSRNIMSERTKIEAKETANVIFSSRSVSSTGNDTNVDKAVAAHPCSPITHATFSSRPLLQQPITLPTLCRLPSLDRNELLCQAGRKLFLFTGIAAGIRATGTNGSETTANLNTTTCNSRNDYRRYYAPTSSILYRLLHAVTSPLYNLHYGLTSSYLICPLNNHGNETTF